MASLSVNTAFDRIATGCRICGSHDLDSIEVREMMFGLRERFHYRECRTCGCLQIAEYLGNLDKYYPSDYYSFSGDQPGKSSKVQSIAKNFGRILKARYINYSKQTRSAFLKSDATQQWLESRPIPRLYVRYVENPRAKILDVGCGSGTLLKSLSYLYYTNLNGCDPFISEDIYLRNHLLVRKAYLHDITQTYDFISFHHVLEHMPDQLNVLKQARTLLAPEGSIMIRIPVVGGAAWRSYRENWVQLDPPRHYYLHSEKSFRMLADQAGLQVESIEYDSSDLQFWGSEMYNRDIPLMEALMPGKSKELFFSVGELAKYASRAQDLNQMNDGDQIVSILKRKPTNQSNN